jgi:putative hydrolase of HD superfamily
MYDLKPIRRLSKNWGYCLLADTDHRAAFAQALIALLHGIEPLKHLPRTGWVDREISTPESVAAHSWRLAVLSWFVAAEEGLDTDRAVRLALSHDIPEAVTGDRTPFDYLEDVGERIRLAANPSERSVSLEADAQAVKHVLERAALAQIVADAPEGVAKELSALWEEYAAESSPEAALVHQLDKLEAYLQGWEYADDGRLSQASTLRSFREDSGRLASSPTTRALFLAIEGWARADERLKDQDSIRPE